MVETGFSSLVSLVSHMGSDGLHSKESVASVTIGSVTANVTRRGRQACAASHVTHQLAAAMIRLMAKFHENEASLIVSSSISD